MENVCQLCYMLPFTSGLLDQQSGKLNPLLLSRSLFQPGLDPRFFFLTSTQHPNISISSLHFGWPLLPLTPVTAARLFEEIPYASPWTLMILSVPLNRPPLHLFIPFSPPSCLTRINQPPPGSKHAKKRVTASKIRLAAVRAKRKVSRFSYPGKFTLIKSLKTQNYMFFQTQIPRIHSYFKIQFSLFISRQFITCHLKAFQKNK